MGMGLGLGGLSFGLGPVSSAPFGEYTDAQVAQAAMVDAAIAAGLGNSPTTGQADTGDPNAEGSLSTDPSEGGGGTGDGGSPSGDTSGEAGSGFHRGGFVGLEPTMYRGQDAPGRERTIKAETGEFVVNKKAASKFAPLLKGLNKLGTETTDFMLDGGGLGMILQQLLK
jgi:hypothetical protein